MSGNLFVAHIPVHQSYPVSMTRLRDHPNRKIPTLPRLSYHRQMEPRGLLGIQTVKGVDEMLKALVRPDRPKEQESAAAIRRPPVSTSVLAGRGQVIERS